LHRAPPARCIYDRFATLLLHIREGTCFIGTSPHRVGVFMRRKKITVERRTKMPLIQVRLVEGVFTKQQKNRMIEKLTDAMVSIEGESMRGVTWVTIEEVRSGDWAIGGKALTTESVKELSSGKPAA
jgi:4-oxalocrotonate tautomerase